MLLASRILQGLAAAAASPNALALITTTFPAGKERNRAMGVYAAMSGAGAAVGLILGGALTEASWRWTFFINTPIGLIVAVLAIRYLGESARQTGKFDLPGAITGTVGLTVAGLRSDPRRAEQLERPDTVAFIAAGVVLIGVFLAIEARSRHALMPFRILANRTRGVSFFAMLIVGAAMFSMFYFLGIFIQNIMGYSALKTGFAFLPFSFGIVVAAQVASTLIARIDPRWIAGVGAALAAGGMFGFSQLEVDSTYVTHLLPYILLLSFGMGLIFVPLTLTAVSGVADEDSGVGSAVLNTVQQIGGAIGLALLGTVSTTAIKDKFTELAPGLAEGRAVRAVAGTGQAAARDSSQAVATTHGFTRAFMVSAFIFLGAAIVTCSACRSSTTTWPPTASPASTSADLTKLEPSRPPRRLVKIEGPHPGRGMWPFVLPGSGRAGGRSDFGPDARGLDRSRQRRDVVGAVVSLTVDEEGGCAGYAAEVCGLDVLGDPAPEDVPLELVMKRIAFQPQFIGVLQQVGDPQPVLPGQQQIVHFPELALRRRSLGCLGRQLRLRVDVGERQMPPYVPDVVIGQQISYDGFGPAAVGAFEVAVLDDCHGGGSRAADVVAGGVDRNGQVDQHIRIAE